jgi:hypothetical protein
MQSGERWRQEGWPSSVNAALSDWVRRMLGRFDPLGLTSPDEPSAAFDYTVPAWDSVPLLIRVARSPEDCGRVIWKTVAEDLGGEAPTMRDDPVWLEIGQAVWGRFQGLLLSVDESWFPGFRDQIGGLGSWPQALVAEHEAELQ